MIAAMQHQFVDRESGKVCTERLIGDKAVRLMYSVCRERAPFLFKALTSARTSRLLASIQYDARLANRAGASLKKYGVDLAECVEPESLTTLRKVFERQIRYWECRSMDERPVTVVSPADSRVIIGSLSESSSLFLKEKFFDLEELLSRDKPEWNRAFLNGDFAVFRLTPDKYHYNHTPVAGQVVDIFEIPGDYHSCNPGAVVALVTPFSKNRRVVTIIDTDVQGGTGVGFVAMIEVVALMIGDIVQAYSETRYENPRPVEPGMFLGKGLPKSQYRPGSSTDVVLFQQGRIKFAEDLLRNLRLYGVQSRFSIGFGRPLVETDLKVRSTIGTSITRGE
ncbi:MAG: phosphatidylserine decarboxylase [Desulfomonilaceae bacterium]